jgi:hypothetical protein
MKASYVRLQNLRWPLTTPNYNLQQLQGHSCAISMSGSP